MSYDFERDLANRILSALDRPSLAALIRREIMPGLAIKESALYLTRDSAGALFYSDGVDVEPRLTSDQVLDDLLAAKEQAPSATSARFGWVSLAVPLYADTHRIGIWLLGARADGSAYDPDAAAQIEALANLIAPVLQNIRLLEEARGLADQFSLLYDAGLALNSVLDLGSQLQYLLDLAMRTLNAERAAMFSYDSVRNTLLFEFGIGFGAEETDRLMSWQFPVSSYGSIVGWVAQNRTPLRIPDVQAHPLWSNIDPAVRSGLWVPVQRDKDLHGVLAVYSTRPDVFSEHDGRLLVLFANQAAVALENARLYKAEMTRREELGGLFDLSRALADAAFDFQAILDLIARRAVETIRATFAQVILAENGEFVVRAAHPIRLLDQDLGVGRRESVEDHPFFRRVMAENRVAIVDELTPDLTEFECRSVLAGIAQSACLVPLVRGDRGIGLIVLGEARRREREPFSADKVSLARSIGDLTLSALYQAELYAELDRSFLQTVSTLAQAVDARDTYTANHAQRLAEMALAVGRALELAPADLEDLQFGAILHDIGKIGIRDSILLKPGPLTAEEHETMRQHPSIGARILAPVPRLENAAKIVRHHHEKYDGSGYPDGLSGESIPLGARILAVVDSFSAMTDNRVYHGSRGDGEALDEIRRGAGAHFDPRVAVAFLELYGKSATKTARTDD